MSNLCRVNTAVQNTTLYSSLHFVNKSWNGGGNATAGRLGSTDPPGFFLNAPANQSRGTNFRKLQVTNAASVESR